MSQWSSTIRWEHWCVRKVFCSHYILYLTIYKTRIFSLTIIWKMGGSHTCTQNSAGFVSLFSLKQSTVRWDHLICRVTKPSSEKCRCGVGDTKLPTKSTMFCMCIFLKTEQCEVSHLKWRVIVCLGKYDVCWFFFRQTATTITDSMVFKLKKGVAINTTHYTQGHITFK